MSRPEDQKSDLKYVVSTFRNAGLEAKWSRNRKGAPIIAVRNPEATLEHQRTKWWLCDKYMFESMQKQGIKEGFDGATILGNYFSI